jgi:hypothetical protein
MVFFEKFLVADSNQIAVCYCIGSVNSGIVKVPAIDTHFLLLGAKNMNGNEYDVEKIVALSLEVKIFIDFERIVQQQI